MMEKLHQASGSIVWKIILALVAISFVLSGVGGYLISNHDTSAIKVNGTELSQHDYYRQYQNIYQQRAAQDPNFLTSLENPDTAKKFKQEVSNTFISDMLKAEFAKDNNMAVSDQNIRYSIVASQVFDKDGKFDNNLYLQTLAQNGLTPDSYAKLVERGMIEEDINQYLLNSDILTKDEIDAGNDKLFQLRVAKIGYLNPSILTNQLAITDKARQTYYEQNKAKFIKPESFDIEYIHLDSTQLVNSDNISDVTLAQYYQDHKDKFSSGKKLHLAHIQVSDEKTANIVEDKLKAGEDFDTLAREFSQDKLTADKGGDLSYVSQGEFPPAFDTAAFSLQVGAYSEPVKLDNNYHIIKLLDVKDGETLALSKVKDLIKDEIVREQATTNFFQLEKDLAEKSFEAQTSLNDVASELGLKLKKINDVTIEKLPEFFKNDRVIRELSDQNFVETGINSDVINLKDLDSIVFRVAKHNPSHQLAFNEVEDKITEQLKNEQNIASLSKIADEIVAKLNAGDKSALNDSRIKFSPAEDFVSAIISEKGDKDELKAVFSIDSSKDKAIKFISDNKIGVANLIEVKNNSESIPVYELLEAQIYNLPLSSKEFDSYLRSKYKVEINQEFIDGLQ